MLEQHKIYTIETVREIPCLNGICGPVTTPVHIKYNDLLWLINNGFEVYQCNPFDKKEKILVTRKNINKIEFKITREGATSKKLLNRSIQDMEKPMVVDVVKKETTKTINKNDAKVDVASETSISPKEVIKTESNVNEKKKVTTPDSFTK